MRLRIKITALVAAATLATGSLVSCGQPAPEPAPIKVSVKTPKVSEDGGSQFVTVVATGAWTLAVEETGGGAPEWARLRAPGSQNTAFTVSGTGSATDVVLVITPNDTDKERSLTLTLNGDGQTANCTVTQDAGHVYVPPVETLTSDPVLPWLELPAVNTPNTYFISHAMRVKGKQERNYAYCWDVDAMVARWVAYPLNTGLIDGTAGREDAWGLDPKVPASMQPRLDRLSYRNKENTTWSGYDRGHQIAQADRMNTSDNGAANVATYYGTNMTPQINKFNAGIWASLEGRVRNWSKDADTLYVVTGCLLEGEPQYTYDEVGHKIRIPSGYFKALLAYGGNSETAKAKFKDYASDGYYTGIAFVFDHKDYGNASPMNYSVTIDELEKRTGFDFFVNLPARAGNDAATRIEAKKGNWFN